MAKVLGAEVQYKSEGVVINKWTRRQSRLWSHSSETAPAIPVEQDKIITQSTTNTQIKADDGDVRYLSVWPSLC